jgi:hypothetical protein
MAGHYTQARPNRHRTATRAGAAARPGRTRATRVDAIALHDHRPRSLPVRVPGVMLAPASRIVRSLRATLSSPDSAFLASSQPRLACSLDSGRRSSNELIHGTRPLRVLVRPRPGPETRCSSIPAPERRRQISPHGWYARISISAQIADHAVRRPWDERSQVNSAPIRAFPFPRVPCHVRRDPLELR